MEDYVEEIVPVCSIRWETQLKRGLTFEVGGYD